MAFIKLNSCASKKINTENHTIVILVLITTSSHCYQLVHIMQGKVELNLIPSPTCGVGDGGAASMGESAAALLANLYSAAEPSC
jgi:hypothetical protein